LFTSSPGPLEPRGDDVLANHYLQPLFRKLTKQENI